MPHRGAAPMRGSKGRTASPRASGTPSASAAGTAPPPPLKFGAFPHGVSGIPCASDAPPSDSVPGIPCASDAPPSASVSDSRTDPDPPVRFIFGSVQPMQYETSTSSYQKLGSRPTPPSIFQSSLITISKPDAPSAPSTTSPTLNAPSGQSIPSTPSAASDGSSEPSIPSTPSPTRRGRARRSKSCRRWGSRSRLSSPSATKSQPSSQKEESINLEEIKSSFKSYMDRHCLGLAEHMWQDESFILSLDYDSLLAENTELAYDIANNFKEVKSRLLAAAKEFLLEQFSSKESDARLLLLLKDKIQKRTKLDFNWMPKSIMSLEDFMKLNPTGTRWLFEGHNHRKHQVAVVSPASRRVTQKIVQYITSAHREGKGWNGKWDIGDWDVINHSSVHLRKVPVPVADMSMWIEDLKATATKVLLKLVHEDTGMIPAFLSHLVWQMQDPDMADGLTEDDFLGWYYEFLEFHPCLMSSRARGILIEGFYYAAVRLNYNKLPRFETLFSDGTFKNWNKFVLKKRERIHDIMWEVYWDGYYPDMSIPKIHWKLPYTNTVDHYLQFLRHVLQHTNKRSVWCGQVTLTAAVEAEMFAADKHRTFLPEFIKMIFQAKRMEAELREVWKLYKSTMGYEDE